MLVSTYQIFTSDIQLFDRLKGHLKKGAFWLLRRSVATQALQMKQAWYNGPKHRGPCWLGKGIQQIAGMFSWEIKFMGLFLLWVSSF